MCRGVFGRGGAARRRRGEGIICARCSAGARSRPSDAHVPTATHATHNSTAASAAVEYKLLTVGDDGSPITWQAGANRVLDLVADAAEVKVADSLEGAAPTVEVVVAAAKAASAGAAPAAAPAPPPSSAVVAAAVASPATPLTFLTVKELKARLAAAGLPTTGKKSALVARLKSGS